MRLRFHANPLESRPTEVMPGVFVHLPATVIATGFSVGEDEFTIKIGLRMINEGMRPTSVEVSSETATVTGTVLRAVPVSRIVEHAVMPVVSKGHRLEGGGIETTYKRPTNEEFEAMRRRGPSGETLEWVAFLYNLAALFGRTPAKAVQEVFGIPRTTATKWIKKARDAGLINGEEATLDGKHQQTQQR